MATQRKGSERHQIAADAAMAGVLALLVDDREERARESKSGAKTEVLLWNAGLLVEDIVAVTGKTPDAVRKTIERARKK